MACHEAYLQNGQYLPYAPGMVAERLVLLSQRANAGGQAVLE
jgi:hypothetical protein